MSWQPSIEAEPGDPKSCDALDMVIVPRMRDIGAFAVHRALPYAKRRMVGPFIFFDQMGPADMAPGRGMDVHPIPISGSPPSPISSTARSSIATASAMSRRSSPAP